MKTKDLKSDDKQTQICPLDAFRNDNESDVARIYDQYRGDFIRFGIKCYGLDQSIAAEIYQDSFIAMYQNVKCGKLSKLTSSLKTYLFRIGVYKILNYKRDCNNHHTQDIDDYQDSVADCDSMAWSHKQEITYLAVSVMEEPCNTVLNLYYWKRKSMAEIAYVMNYRNEQVAKNRKSLCIKKLKEYLLDKFRSEGLS